jgi:anti-sigma regulatory factor (Ser/Thr protein kinase)
LTLDNQEPGDKPATDEPEPADPADVFTSDVDAESLPSLRGEITAFAVAHGLTDVALMKFVIAVYEIATNAVRHGGGQGQLRVWPDQDSLWCEVTDHGHGIPAEYQHDGQRHRGERISGWGLWLTRQVCTEVRITGGTAGSRVLLRYPRTGDRRSA